MKRPLAAAKYRQKIDAAFLIGGHTSQVLARATVQKWIDTEWFIHCLCRGLLLLLKRRTRPPHAQKGMRSRYVPKKFKAHTNSIVDTDRLCCVRQRKMECRGVAGLPRERRSAG